MQTGTGTADQRPDDPSFEAFTVGLPERTLAGSDTESTSSSSSDSFFLQTRDYPHVIYTESGSDSQSNAAPARWTNRPLKCVKYVDDCLSIEKLCFAGTDLNSETNKHSVRAIQTEEHIKIVETNAKQKK